MKTKLLLIFLLLFPVLISSQTFFQSNEQGSEPGYLLFSHTPSSINSVNAIVPDWIYDTRAPILSSLKSADVNGDGIKEVVVSTYDTTEGNPYGAGMIYVIDNSGNDLNGWPVRLAGAPIPATIAVGDIDANDNLEIIVGSWNKLYVFDYQGNMLPGFPKNLGTSVAAALFDLDKDGYLEIIYPSSNKNLYIFNYDGSLLPGWPQALPEMPGSPAIADINNDDEFEIVAGTFQGPVGPDPFFLYAWEMDGSVINGFPVSLSGVIKSTPAIGDLDDDGTMEITAISYDDTNEDSLYVFDSAGNLKSGFPVGISYARLSSPALGDIDGDGDLEIVAGGWFNAMEILYGFHHDGSAIQNFPVLLAHPGNSSNVNNSPVICDIDGDTTSVEIVVKVQDFVFAIHHDTTTVNGFPYFINDENQSATHSPSPLIDDFDGDGDVEYVFASIAGKIHFFDMTEAYNENFGFWNSYKHDMQNTGAILQIPIFTDVNEPGNTTPSKFILFQNYPNPFNPGTKIRFTIPSSLTQSGVEGSMVTLKVYDVLGNEIATLVNDELPAGTYVVEFNSHSGSVRSAGSGLPSGIYYYRLTAGVYGDTKKMILLK